MQFLKPLGLGLTALILIGGLIFLHTYTQISASVVSIEFGGIQMAKPDPSTLARILIAVGTGQYLQLGLSLVDAIILRVTVEIHNPGIIPITISSITWTLVVNDIELGPGNSATSIVVASVSKEAVTFIQDIKPNSLPTLALAIATTGGELQLRVEGKADINLVSVPIKIPFERVERISILEAIKNTLQSFS